MEKWKLPPDGGHMDYCTYWSALLTILKALTGAVN